MRVEDKRKLKSRIYEVFGTETAMAKHLNWPKQKLNRITNGKREPDLVEACEMANALGEPLDSFSKIFLPN